MIDVFIKGNPSTLRRSRGNRKRSLQWKQAIIKQTRYCKKVVGPCKMNVIFYFEKSQFPKDFPYGPDIDNHLKSFQDALNKTIFAKAPGQDSCVVEIAAKKHKGAKKTGAHLRIRSTRN